MAIDPKLLEILVCPVDKTPLEVVSSPTRFAPAWSRSTANSSRMRTRWSRSVSPRPRVGSIRWFPGIPVMLVDEALSREEIEG